MTWFFEVFTPQYPYLSSALKFLILGTFGEYLGAIIRTGGNWKTPFPMWKVLPKAAIWAVLGLTVKWAFSTFSMLVPVQAASGLLPRACGEVGTIWFALAVSIELNIFYAPSLMALHRLLDNLTDLRWNWHGIHVALITIFWFWIPAQTVTFMLPANYRVMFAAILSVVLGVVMGYAARPAAVKETR